MKKNITLILILIICLSGKGQDAQFAQYYATSLFLNPAFGGVYNNISVHVNYKRQPQNTDLIDALSLVSLIFPIKPNGELERSIGCIGVMFYNEKSGLNGIFENNAAFINYAHNLKFGVLSAYILSFGVQIGYEQQSVGFSKLSWGSQWNPYWGWDDLKPRPVVEFDQTVQNLIINAGFMYHYNPDRNYLLHKFNSFFGLSASNINQPNESYRLSNASSHPLLVKYTGGTEIKVGKFYLTPSILGLYRRKQFQFNAGLNISFSPKSGVYTDEGIKLIAGTWYRFRDSFTFMGGIKFDNLVIRGSYDLNTKLFVSDRPLEVSNNTIEISLQYSFAKRSGFKKLSNPLF